MNPGFVAHQHHAFQRVVQSFDDADQGSDRGGVEPVVDFDGPGLVAQALRDERAVGRSRSARLVSSQFDLAWRSSCNVFIRDASPTPHVRAAEMTPDPNPRPSLDGLTFVRFIAALHVVFFHLWSGHFLSILEPTHGNPILDTLARMGQAVASTGYASVSLFFVLSGFILSYSYERRPPKTFTERKKFWMSRFARIYPTYVFGLGLFAPIIIYLIVQQQKTAGRTLASLMLNLLLVQSWSGATALSWNPPGWSLSAEAFFYAVFPFLLVPLLRQSTRSLLAALVATFAVGMTAPALYVATNIDHIDPATWAQAYFADAPVLLTIKFLPLLRLPEFLLGMILGVLFLRQDSHRENARSDLAVLTLACGIVWALLLVRPVDFPFLHNGLLSPMFGALIYFLARARYLGRFSAGRWPRLLGESSFALYIIHGPILVALTLAIGPSHGSREIGDPALSLLYVVAAVALSVVVHRHLELPARAAILRRAGVTGPSRPPPTLTAATPPI